jgi:hypothetical protein
MTALDTLDPVKVDAAVVCDLVSQLGTRSQLVVLRHLFREFSMFDCAEHIDVAADEIELELLREDAAIHGPRTQGEGM